MKRLVYKYPKSSFLSIDKDMNMIMSKMLENKRLKKLLFYTSDDALEKADVSMEDTIGMMNKNVKNVPKLYVDGSVLNYVIISMDNFTPSKNPQFRDNVIEFDIVCHLENWQLKDFQLRPFKIAAELDYMFNKKRLTGIGLLEFLSAQEKVLSDEYAAVCLKYIAYHGGEDKYYETTPKHEEQLQKDFWNYRKNKKE